MKHLLILLENKMKKIICLFACLLTATVNASPVSLDFNTGMFSGSSSYTEDGFTFSANSNGNHFDNGWAGSIGFHNGLANSVYDNDFTLSFGGNAFDFLDIDLSNFYNSGTLDLIGSDGSLFSSSSLGLQSVDFYNITFVTFSIADKALNYAGGASWRNITVDNVATVNNVPEPASLALFFLGLGILGLSRKNKAMHSDLQLNRSVA